jgi:hypothetical protein
MQKTELSEAGRRGGTTVLQKLSKWSSLNYQKEKK